MKKEEFIYKVIDEAELKLQLFWPENRPKDKLSAAIVFFFGGGWSGGTPEQFYPHCEYYASKGVVSISAEYRVRSRHGVSPIECIKDAKSAIRWAREHAAEMAVDPAKIVAGGGSAGGHVAACTALIKGLDDHEDNLRTSCVPEALVLFNPAVDLTRIRPKGHAAEELSNEDRKKISPMFQIVDGLPPTIIFHGTDDDTVPYSSVETFTEKMKDAGNICDLVPFKGKKHGFFNYNRDPDHKSYLETLKATDEFLTSLFILDL